MCNAAAVPVLILLQGKPTHHLVTKDPLDGFLVNKKKWSDTPVQTLEALIALLAAPCPGWPVQLAYPVPNPESESQPGPQPQSQVVPEPGESAAPAVAEPQQPAQVQAQPQAGSQEAQPEAREVARRLMAEELADPQPDMSWPSDGVNSGDLPVAGRQQAELLHVPWMHGMITREEAEGMTCTSMRLLCC